MAEADKASPSNPQDDDETLRRRLLKRVAIAGALVVVLLGGLALFDALYVKTEKEPPTRVAAVGSLTPSEPKEAEKAIEEKPGAEKAIEEPESKPGQAQGPEVTAEPELSSAPLVLPSPPKPERPLTVPAQARPAMMRPTEPVAAVAKSAAAPAAAPTLASRPIAAAVESAQRFLLQMGVFSNGANAEELRAKLELAGLPTQIETRVQVGPFASRHEADMAREKLKAMGMEPGLLMAVRK